MTFVARIAVIAALVAAACTPSTRPGSASAESMVSWNDYGDLSQLVGAADLVVEGRVLQRVGSRDVRADPRQRVPVAFTESVIEVRAALKGSASGELRVVQLGREGDPAQSYPEFPVLRPGDDVVLFLVDVTNDPILAGSAARYGIIAPVGLFRVRGGSLTTSAGSFDSTREALALGLDGLRSRVRALVLK